MLLKNKWNKTYLGDAGRDKREDKGTKGAETLAFLLGTWISAGTNLEIVVGKFSPMIKCCYFMPEDTSVQVGLWEVLCYF